MPKYPTKKTDKTALYAAVLAGIGANAALYPSGPGAPFATVTLNALITAKNTAVNTRQQEEGQFRGAVAAEDDAFDNVDEEVRRLLNLAIATHGIDSPHLTLIGWGPRADGVSQPPGQPRVLEAIVQGPGDVFLDWKAPAPGGGKVAWYLVERRKRTIPGVPIEDWGAWQATTAESELMITDLERGVEHDFRVTAYNSAGGSIPSNIVSMVL